MNFSLEERDFMFGLLEHELWRLREEIHRTDSISFKEPLHDRERMIEGILEKMRAPVADNSTAPMI